MVRNIILLSDGTGNSAAKLAKTNVWRTYQAIDLSGPDQIASYDNGVGTSSLKPLALLGSAFGWGLKRNVLDLYKFLCRNYREANININQKADRIFAFGFSRGAFTIRVLVGLVLSQGLVRWNSEEELDLLSKAAYREFREQRFKRRFSLTWIGRLVLRAIVKARTKAAGRQPYNYHRNLPVPSIAFLGLWDTVDAYGMPIKELKIAIDKFIWPLYFDSPKLDVRVERACHALALDDERATFHPLVWDESDEPADGTPKRVKQVWFSGMHSNVGGGYPDDALSQVSLLWVLENAKAAGLRLKHALEDEYRITASPYGRMYDSRSGLSAYYRYAPRKVTSTAAIHESVYLRMSNGGDQYAPISLPAPVATESEYEIAWDTVWWRAIAYWLMVGLTGLLLSLGWTTLPWPKFDNYAVLAVRPLVDAIKVLVPSMLEGWLEHFAESPAAVLALITGVAGAYVWGRFLKGRIRDRAAATWLRDKTAKNRQEWFKQSRQRWNVGTRLLLTATIAAFVLATFRADKAWIIGTFACMVAALAILVLRRWYDTKRWAHLKSPGAVEAPGWGLSVARVLRTSPAIVASWAFLTNKVIPFAFAMALIAASAYGLNRIGFEVLKLSGQVCSARGDAKPLGLNDEKIVSLRTSDPCSATGVLMEQSAKYEIELSRPEGWMDDDIPVPTTDGFESDAKPAPWYLFLATPMKRDVGQNWFKPIAVIGAHFQTKEVLGQKTQFVVDKRSGELFLFVNDATLGVPGIWDVFYRNNQGDASVVIRKIGEGAQPKE